MWTENNIEYNVLAQGLYSTIKDRSAIVKSNSKNGKGSVIVLHSCDSSKDENSISYSLSEMMEGSIIIAPTSKTDGKGNVTDNGHWNVILNGKVVRTISGDEQSFNKELNTIDNNVESYYKSIR